MFRFFRMRVSSGWRMLMPLALGWLIVNQAGAQGFGLSVTPSANPVQLSSNLTYTILLTNSTLSALSDTLVSNTLAGSFQLLGVTTSQGTIFTNSTTAVFDLGTFVINGVAQMTITVQPTAVGSIADAVTVVSTGPTFTAAAAVVTEVTNVPPATADVAVAMTVPSSQVYSNDWMVYGVLVTNMGPATAPGIFLTNTLPAGVGFKGVSPSNQTFTISIQSNHVVFGLGSLTNQAFRNFNLTVQPTNAGVLPFVSTVNTNSSVLDPNLANNVASNNITISDFLAGQVDASIVSTQQYNPQDGLVEQSIAIANTGSNALAAVRVIVTGLSNRLYNAVGTNNGNPLVVYVASLDTNQSVDLLLQYAATAYFPFNNTQLVALPVVMPNLTPLTATATSTNLNLTRQVQLAGNGDMLIEFQSVTNRRYTVVYSDNLLFSNAMVALPSVVAPANRTQWIDYGPPTTASHPTNASARFYRVYLNP